MRRGARRVTGGLNRIGLGEAGETMARGSDQTAPDASGGAGRQPRSLAHRLERRREVGLSVILGLLAVTMFVVSPLAALGLISSELVEALRFGLAATAILVVNRSRLIGVCVGATFVVSLIVTLYVRSGAAGEAIHLANVAFTIAFDAAVAWTVARAAFDSGRITFHRIMGAVILYLYIGLIFSGVYRMAAMLLHPAFNGLATGRSGNLSALLYFSLSTLTTSGYGDVTPVHPFVRSLANLEAVIGQLYPATFLARLVTLHGTVAETPLVGRRLDDDDQE